MADMTKVKSSKVGTILAHDSNAKLHVIAGTIVSVHWEAYARATSNEWAWNTRNGLPRTQ